MIRRSRPSSLRERIHASVMMLLLLTGYRRWLLRPWQWLLRDYLVTVGLCARCRDDEIATRVSSMEMEEAAGRDEKRSWLLFFDALFGDEGIGVYEDSPQPP